ncbi:HAD family hydrolase [Gracilibacillus sp. S3-1-1]|uniref:HAD family hydrolase n=1 Tax=Gracilibacillus pellucidus TaxID=3095368 RepID=A0ACC6M4H5_9BACI|nr:HAD family hydrolase [Gracilibacillus sp. S3-1-1]MDX8045869.1 HAD family hydrolase [Gracilibacillus sp. S3-1-1]
MIFFDIDGTLLDHDRAEKLAAVDFHKQYYLQLNVDEKEFVQKWFQLSHQYFDLFLQKQLSFAEQRRLRIKGIFGQQLSNQQADDLFQEYLLYYKRNWSIFDDVIPCLENLQQAGHRLGIITNGEKAQQLEKLQTVGIETYFEHILTSSEVGVAKPTPKIFHIACKQANVNTAECYYIGDRLKTDAEASQKAGMFGIWLNREQKILETDVKQLQQLAELVGLLKIDTKTYK